VPVHTRLDASRTPACRLVNPFSAVNPKGHQSTLGSQTPATALGGSYPPSSTKTPALCQGHMPTAPDKALTTVRAGGTKHQTPQVKFLYTQRVMLLLLGHAVLTRRAPAHTLPASACQQAFRVPRQAQPPCSSTARQLLVSEWTGGHRTQKKALHRCWQAGVQCECTCTPQASAVHEEWSQGMVRGLAAPEWQRRSP
jgi:hypothetical protein